MNNVNVDIVFLDHLRACMGTLLDGGIDRIKSPGEKAMYYAIAEMALEQLETIINESRLQRDQA